MRDFCLSALRNRCLLIAVALLSVTQTLCANTPSSIEILMGVRNASSQIQPPYFFAKIDSAGYSDWIWYGESPDHPHDYHELLCGEWATAIYYEGIGTKVIDSNNLELGSEAMWLTNKFIFPDWFTNSDFLISSETPSLAWDDPNNPTPQNDTGKTVIVNGQVEVTVDLEIVDLNSIAGGVRSPMSYRCPGIGNVLYRDSDRYVMLQTYTVRNIKTETLKGLELYQMLHAHPADEKSAAIFSVYEDQAFYDPLEFYTPSNPVHQIGNFRYDITQWNETDSVNATADHADWVGFSSTIEPNVVDHDVFEGHGNYKPPVGTHINIEKRQLNGEVELFNAEPGAAMGWMLGDLEPDETRSLTFMVSFGHNNITESSLYLEKTSQINPSNPCGLDPTDPNFSWIDYTIEYGNPIHDVNDPNFARVISNATIVDQLSDSVQFVSATPANYIYDPVERTVTWDIGQILPDEYDSVSITVNATMAAEPSSNIVNRAVLMTEIGTISSVEETKVCCWTMPGVQNEIIFVDASAEGDDNGTTWGDAFVDLQKALQRARNGCGNQVWVAQGYYNPTENPRVIPISYTLADGVDMYGGFPSKGGTWDDRDFVSNKTYLCGDVNGSGFYSSVIDANDIGNVILDGFIITNGTNNGLSFKRSQLQISNCYIANNSGSGIFCDGSDLIIVNSVISHNGQAGVTCSDDPAYPHRSMPMISGNKIYANYNYGICVETASSRPTIVNNWIFGNGNFASGGSGICIDDSQEVIAIRNNTIVGNIFIGIEVRAGSGPDVSNSIIWNHPMPLLGCSAAFSCFEDAPPINGNIDIEPQFAYEDPNDYHLGSNSPCIDSGSLWGVDPNEIDIDGNDRVISTTIDIGADEYSCDDIYSIADFDVNASVDMDDFMGFANNWLAHFSPSDPNDQYDIAPEQGDDKVDVQDLGVFMDQWQWRPCWLDLNNPNWINRNPEPIQLLIMEFTENLFD